MTYRIVLDVSSLMYRAFFAMGDGVRSPRGEQIGAVHAYVDWVARLLVSYRPDEVVHAYDHDWRPVARTEIYPGYKSTRPPDPVDLPPQFDLLRTVLDQTGMLQVQTEGWEAEDAIGAVCTSAELTDRIDLVSGDRDLIQLVRDPVVRLLFTVRGVSDLLVLDEAGVLEKYGVPADRYAEFAMLRGDPSDDLPGVHGVGEKTARALVEAYPSIDAMLADAERDTPAPGPLKGKPALRARLRESVDYLDRVRRIVPVNATAPLQMWSGPRNDVELKRLAEGHGLRGPVQRLIAALDSLG